MSELVDEDVFGGCTRVMKAEPEGLCPPPRAIYSSLLYLL
jgi:hypothetical protein